MDRYHKNKALRQAVSALKTQDRKNYKSQLYLALCEEDKERFQSIAEEILNLGQGKQKIVRDNLTYLANHIEAIHICYTDLEATNGGASEPHVSHILSSRLSSRPMAWSKHTLKHFAPILGAKRFSLKNDSLVPLSSSQKNTQLKKAKAFPFSLGLADPDRAVRLPACSGKVTPLFCALRYL